MSARGPIHRILETLTLVVVGCASNDQQGQTQQGACTPDEVLECPCSDGTMATQQC